MMPDRYAWTIFTSGEPDHYVFDGRTARSFVGGREVSADESPGAPLRSHARFMSVSDLDVLLLPGVRVEPVQASELPSGAASGLVVAFGDDRSRYRLAFDERALLVSVSGPIAITRGTQRELTARFTDFRRIKGFLLPFRTAYAVDGAGLADERVLAICPNDRELGPDAFVTPASLRGCEPTS